MSSRQSDGPALVCVTMSEEAAERFVAALTYAAAVVASLALNPAPATAEKIREHGQWLRWGIGRVENAEVDDA